MVAVMTDGPVRIHSIHIPQEFAMLPDLRIYILHSADLTYLGVRSGEDATPVLELAVPRGEAVRLGEALVEGNRLGE
jgi:hypothetical protein